MLSSVPASVTFMTSVPSGSETDAMISPAESGPDSDHHEAFDMSGAKTSLNVTIMRRSPSITADTILGGMLSFTWTVASLS